MSRLKSVQNGFTLVELMVVIVVIGIASSIFAVGLNSSAVEFFKLQKSASNFSDLASQSQRISKVLRGLTDIISAQSDEIKTYAYFAPSDQFVSLIRYYKNPEGNAILADVTQMTSNPPVGIPIAGSLKTYTIFDNFYQVPGQNLFTYLNSDGAILPPPIGNLNSIKGIRVNLAVPQNNLEKSQSITMEVNLRNRKTNL